MTSGCFAVMPTDSRPTDVKAGGSELLRNRPRGAVMTHSAATSLPASSTHGYHDCLEGPELHEGPGSQANNIKGKAKVLYVPWCNRWIWA